jgi:hypothetical protein
MHSLVKFGEVFMGKNSLLKSTSKKKGPPKKKDDKTPEKTAGTKTGKKAAGSGRAKTDRSVKKQQAATGPLIQKQNSRSMPEAGIDSQQKPLKTSKDAEKEIESGRIPGKVPGSKVTLPDMASCDTKGSDSMEKALKYFGVGLAIIFILIIGASLSNMNKYYIQPADGGIEIWKGNFSPMSKELLIRLPDVQAPEPIKAFYSKREIAPFASAYYSQKADALLNQPGTTDLEEIKSYLHKARSYSFSMDQQKAIDRRLAGIDFTIFLYKADVAAGKGTIADIETALGYLDEAALLDIDLNQTDLLIHKMDALNQLKSEIESKQE